MAEGQRAAVSCRYRKTMPEGRKRNTFAGGYIFFAVFPYICVSADAFRRACRADGRARAVRKCALYGCERKNKRTVLTIERL